MTFGFIILRYVNSELTNKYWINCYNCIRKFYPENEILIIDDNSHQNYISMTGECKPHGNELYKVKIIDSEYPRRGELLPYYYYLKNPLFDTAVIIHDSVFINKWIDFEGLKIDKYKYLWTFDHKTDLTEDEIKIIKMYNDTDLLNFYNNKNLWNGCFGGMMIITHKYLSFVNEKYNISNLLHIIKSRYNRCCFERVIGCLLEKENDDLQNDKGERLEVNYNDTLFGNIDLYCSWGIKWDNMNTVNHLPLIKVWTGR
jgi:hypothetical protein